MEKLLSILTLVELQKLLKYKVQVALLEEQQVATEDQGVSLPGGDSLNSRSWLGKVPRLQIP